MRLAAISLLLMLAFGGPSLAGESDRDRAVRYAAALEASPLSDEADEQRSWLLTWLLETPDYTVTVCDILGPVPSQEVPYGPELLFQQMFGNVAYQIKNPDIKDPVTPQLAGVESLLKVYAAILASDPKVQHPYFDELLAKQQAGTLKQHLSPDIERACA